MRKLDEGTLKKAKEMLGENPSRKLVRQHFAQKTGKPLIMRDIHNIAWSLKSQNKSSVTSLPSILKKSGLTERDRYKQARLKVTELQSVEWLNSQKAVASLMTSLLFIYLFQDLYTE